MEKNIFTKFSNDRSEEFNIYTVITLDDYNLHHVYKRAASKKSVAHVENMKRNAEKLEVLLAPTTFRLNRCSSVQKGVAELEYIQGKSFEEELDEALRLDDHGEHFLELLAWYRDELYKIAKCSFKFSDAFAQIFLGQELERDDSYKEYVDVLTDAKLLSTAITDIDLIFPNIINTDNGYTILDYEWTFECLIPIDFVIYRSLFFYLSGERNGKIQKLMGDFDLYDYLNINCNLIQTFEKMESSFQAYIAGDNVPLWKLYNQKSGPLYAVQSLAEREEIERKKNIAELYVDGIYREKCYAVPMGEENLMRIPVLGNNMKIRFNEGLCQYRIGGVYGFDNANQIVGCHYTTNGRGLYGDLYVTGNNCIEIEIKDIPDCLENVFLNYKLEATSVKSIMHELENTAQLEMQISNQND